jgi:hypothetical protein
MDVHPPKNGISRDCSIAIKLCLKYIENGVTPNSLVDHHLPYCHFGTVYHFVAVQKTVGMQAIFRQSPFECGSNHSNHALVIIPIMNRTDDNMIGP